MKTKDVSAAIALGTHHGEVRWEDHGTFRPLKSLPKNSSEWYGLGEDDDPRPWPAEKDVMLAIANAFARDAFDSYKLSVTGK
jgi:hypothetical protein